MPKSPSPPRWVEMVITLQRGVARSPFHETSPTPEDCRHVLNSPVIVRGNVQWKQRAPGE